ncbi:hypothetical protein ACROYT_G006937 [Oculina patagonica]
MASSTPVFGYYDPDKPVRLSVVASSKGLGACSTLLLGMVVKQFIDSVHEGDAECEELCWKPCVHKVAAKLKEKDQPTDWTLEPDNRVSNLFFRKGGKPSKGACGGVEEEEDSEFTYLKELLATEEKIKSNLKQQRKEAERTKEKAQLCAWLHKLRTENKVLTQGAEQSASSKAVTSHDLQSFDSLARDVEKQLGKMGYLSRSRLILIRTPTPALLRKKRVIGIIQAVAKHTPTRASFEISLSDMEGDFEEDSHQRLTVDIRILSGKKKSSFQTARVKGFPVAETHSHDEMDAPSSSVNDKIEAYTIKLKEKHGENAFQPYQYRIWAEMLALGSPKSEDEAPALPIFRPKMAKKPSRVAAEHSSTVGSSVPGYSHAEILLQLKELNDLKAIGALTDEECYKQQNAIV